MPAELQEAHAIDEILDDPLLVPVFYYQRGNTYFKK
jgi:hypothetical protein